MIWPVMGAFVGAGLLFAGIGVPLARRRVPRNPWYGFRVPKTLRDDAVWYPANAYAGRLLIGTGAIVAVIAVVTAPAFSNDESASVTAYVTTNTIVLFAALAIMLVLSFRFLRTLS